MSAEMPRLMPATAPAHLRFSARILLRGGMLAGGMLAGLLAAAGADAADPTPAPAGTEIAAGTPGAAIPPSIFVIDPQSLTQERARNKVVDQVRDALSHSGVDPLYAPAATSELALRDAALEALRRNLDIKRSGLAKAVAERALIEAQAVFDPVFVASTSATLNNSFRRVEHPDNKYKPATERVLVGATDSKGVFRCTPAAAQVTQGVDQGVACYVITLSPRSAVLTQQFTRNRPEGDYGSTEDANKPSPFRPRGNEVYNGSVQTSSSFLGGRASISASPPPAARPITPSTPSTGWARPMAATTGPTSPR